MRNKLGRGHLGSEGCAHHEVKRGMLCRLDPWTLELALGGERQSWQGTCFGGQSVLSLWTLKVAERQVARGRGQDTSNNKANCGDREKVVRVSHDMRTWTCI
mmetsp:Transcript_5301/g.12673  ORF Transcript_5301/g.12673 Transcript_5301/m.12673 type:complete len:102 (+) Transcript_5301:192-497(+)